MQVDEDGNVLLETLVALGILLISLQAYLGLNYALLRRVSFAEKIEASLKHLEEKRTLTTLQIQKGTMPNFCKIESKTTNYIYASCDIQDKTYKFANF